MKQKKLRAQKEQFKAVTMNCNGCGATVVFPEGEVMTHCDFCGRALARGEFLETPDFPELIISFRLTAEEARTRLTEWCDRNALKKESRHLKACLDDMQGYYLPYELIRGPVDCTVTREGMKKNFTCGGFLNGIFVNASSQLDNLTLDGMEPYDLNEIQEFEFAYLARQKAKIKDISQEQLDKRVGEEVAADYTSAVVKVLETRDVSVSPDVATLLRMPVMLPVYFVRKGKVMAAVNGQTGKVAVRSERVRKTLPWWIRPIVATLATFLVSFAAMWYFSRLTSVSFYGAGAFTLVMGLIFYTAYSNEYEGLPRTELNPKIFTTAGQYLRGEDGQLYASDRRIEQEPVLPVFFAPVNGTRTEVHIRFTTFGRFCKQMLYCVTALFLPILLAFVLNGFSYHGLHPSGAAVWLCIFVPVVPAYYIKLGRMDIYLNPYIYTVDPKGKKHRVRNRSNRTSRQDILDIILCSPFIILGLFLLLVLVINTYLVLGG